MRVLIVYDSVHGNTEKIATAIGSAFAGATHVVQVGYVNSSSLEDSDLLIVGSPTQGGRPTQPIKDLLKEFTTAGGGRRFAAFDTRMSAGWVRIFGFAADRIASSLRSKGWTQAAPPEGFFVAGREGPLKEGEVERAVAWAKALSESQH